MKIETTEFEDLLIINNLSISDERGRFFKPFNYDFFKHSKLDTDYKEFYYSISKKNLIVGDDWNNTHKICGSDNIVVLIDEFFYIKPDILNQINSNPHVKHIIGFGTPNKLYPKKLVKLVRKNIDSNIIFKKYIEKMKIYNPEYKQHIKDLIEELENNIIINPEFEIINTVQKTKRYNNLNCSEEQRLLNKGNYLISDEKYLELFMKSYPTEEIKFKYEFKPKGF